MPGVSVLSSFCSARLYIRTYRCVCQIRTFIKSIISISIQSDAAKAKREDHGSRGREGSGAV